MRPQPIILLVILFFSLAASAQSQQELSSEFVRHILVLRNFYTGQKLKFDDNGVLLSGGSPGSIPSEGRVYVEAVQLEPDRLIIRGERPVSVFDPATGETTLLGLHQKTTAEIQLPSGKSARELLDQVFLTPEEVDALACSAEEEHSFQQWAARTELVSAKQDRKLESDPVRRLCFPGGSRAYLAGGSVVAPKPLKTFDPPFPPGQLGKHENTAVVLAAIVDTDGKSRSLVVIGSATTEFDLAAINAVQAWKFLPGSYQGKAVPTAIDVQVDFKVP